MGVFARLSDPGQQVVAGSEAIAPRRMTALPGGRQSRRDMRGRDLVNAVVGLKNTTCWIGDSSNEHAMLEVDYGCDHILTNVGTQGRFPIVRERPDHDDLVQRGAGHRYSGKRCLCVNDDRQAGSWVCRYELLYRVCGGREWLPLGVFEGNSDCTTEVTHHLVLGMRNGGFHGVTARYLRFRPLDYHNAKAMRVAAYGTPTLLSGGRGRSPTRSWDVPVVKYVLDTQQRPMNMHYKKEKYKDIAGISRYKDDASASGSKKRSIDRRRMQDGLGETGVLHSGHTFKVQQGSSAVDVDADIDHDLEPAPHMPGKSRRPSSSLADFFDWDALDLAAKGPNALSGVPGAPELTRTQQ